MGLRIHRRDTTYFINDKDQISYTTRDGFVVQPSDTWRLLGAVEMRMCYGRFVQVRWFSTADIRAGKVPWKFKNGKQRCFVVDFDHGSTRMWAHPGDYYSTNTVD